MFILFSWSIFKQMISYIIEGNLIYVYIYFRFVYIHTYSFCISIFFNIYSPHTEIHKYDSAIYIPFLSIFVLIPLECPRFSTFFNKIHYVFFFLYCYKPCYITVLLSNSSWNLCLLIWSTKFQTLYVYYSSDIWSVICKYFNECII